MSEQGSLFDSDQLRSLRESLPPEEMANYEQYGKYMYNNLDIYNASVSGQPTIGLDDYAEAALRSGADPSILTPAEVDALATKYGSEWYEQFGIAKEDLPTAEPVVVNPPPIKVKRRPNKKNTNRRLVNRKN